MKNIKYISQQDLVLGRFFSLSGWFFIMLITFSCEDLLEEAPKSIAVETFYNTLDEAETAVNAIYLPIGENLHNGEIGVNSVLSEFTYGRGSWAALNSYTGLNDTWKTRVSGRWTSDYLAIRNANIVIGNLPDAPLLSQSDKDKLVGEAKFLRAFVYFQLARNWGGVPLRTEQNILTINVNRSTEAEVYSLILDDLLDAEVSLPDEPRLIGTPSKWAAKTFLADVYLNMEMYNEASSKANEVINSGKYDLVPVSTTDDFQNLFGANILTTPEEIFYSRFSHVSGQGNVWPGLMAHPATGLYGNAGVYGVHSLSTNIAYQSWNNNDLRRGQWFPWDIGVGPDALLSKKLIDPETPGLAGGATPITWYRYADVLFMYAESAARVNSGPTAEAVEAVNQIHRRAYGYDPTVLSPVDFNIGDYNLTTFLDLILQERGYEFELEGKRWHDLKRFGKADEIISSVKGSSVSNINFLWPIPVNEFNFNLSLDPITDQNPGY